MCLLCNGTKVIHEYLEYGYSIHPCPNCKTSKEEWEKKNRLINKRIREAQIRLGLVREEAS